MAGLAEAFGQRDRIQNGDFLAVNLNQTGLTQVSQQTRDCDAC